LDSFGGGEIRLFDTSCSLHLRDGLRFGDRNGVRNDGLLPKLRAVEVVLPLLMSVLGRECNVSLSSDAWVNEISGGVHVLLNLLIVVHLPNADDQVAELAVPLDVSVQESVILNKVLERHNLVVSEVLVCTVQAREEIQEFELGFVDGLHSGENLGVAAWVELGLQFVEFEHSILVHIDVIESFLNEPKTVRLQLCNQVVEEQLIINASTSVLIIDLKDHLEFARLHVRNFEVVKSLQELIQSKETSLVTVDDLELLLQSNVTTDASSP